MKQRIFSLLSIVLLILTLLPGSAMALAEGEQGHNHADGYCYVCGQGDPSYARSYNVAQYTEDGSGVVVIGETWYQSLGEAVQAAQPGDRLDVVGDILLSDPILIDKSLTIAGPQERVTITRNFSGEAMFTVTYGASLNLGYLILDGGYDRGYSGYSIFHVLNGASLGLSTGTVLRNSRAGYGGGVYVDPYSVVQLNSSDPGYPAQITQCYADYSGGGIYSEGSVQILEGGSVTGNQASYGGGIWSMDPIYAESTDGIYGNFDDTGNGDILIASNEQLPDETAYDGEQVYDGEQEIFGEGTDVSDSWDLIPGDSVQQTHTVYLDPGDGMSELVPVEVADGATVPQPVSIERDGYTFTGWIYYPYNDGQAYEYDFTAPVYQDLTIIATWQPAETEVTYWQVSFDFGTDGFYADTQSVPDGAYAYDPYNAETMQRDGYSWGGWYYYTSDGVSPFSFEQPVTQDYYLSANWIEIETTPAVYTVTFDPNDGSGMPAAVSVTAGETAQQPTAEWPGYTLIGWYFFNEYGEYVPYDFTSPVNQDLKLYAEWEEIPQYTVYFDFNADGEIADTSQTVAYGANVNDPYDPNTMIRDGYTWQGWFYKDEYGEEYPFDFSYAITSDWQVYGKWSRSTWQVTYDFNADGEIPSETVSIEAGGYATPPNIAREGYELVGWYIHTDEGQILYDWATPVNSDMTLTAQWSYIEPETEEATSEAAPERRRSVTTTEEATSETTTEEATSETTTEEATSETTTEEATSETTTEEATSETSTEEATSETSTEKKRSETTSEEETTEVQQILLRFDANGGSGSIPDIPGNAGSQVVLPDSSGLTRPGYDFDGWNTQADGEGTPYRAGEELTLTSTDGSDMILYAQWTPAPTEATLTYHANAEEVSGSTDSQTGYAGDPIAVSGSGFSRTGYTFVKWNTLADGTGTDYAPGELYTLSGSGNDLYAIWRQAPQSATLIYEPNGGSGSVASGTGFIDGSVTVASNGFTRQNYMFTGWNTSADGSGTPYLPGDVYVLRGSENHLYAQWKAVAANATLTYHPNAYHVTGSTASGTGKVGSSVTVSGNGFSRTGYVFTGWNTMANGSGKAYAPGSSFLLQGAVNDLYAQWEVATYSVTFMNNYNDTVYTIRTVNYGQSVLRPEDPVRPGYTFVNWYTDSLGINVYNFSDGIYRNLTLFARWQPIPVRYFNVYFVTEHGSAPQTQSVQAGQRAYKPADPVAAGYLFGGWYLDSNYTVMFNFDTPVTANITLYAKWAIRPDQEHVVSFDANGHGNAPNPQTVRGGAAAQKPEDPSAIGYTFTGWYIDAQCRQVYNFQSVVTSDMTLYAGWTVNRYTIRFDANGGTGTMASITCAYDQKTNLPANIFARTGYYFIGWNTAKDGSGTFIADQGQILNLTQTNGATVDLFAQWKNIYNVIEGANARIMKGGSQGFTFKTDGDFSKFTGIRIDGHNVSSSQYTAYAGSTYVTLHQDYLEQLSIGTHTIRFEYTDGSVETEFEIMSRTPKTGDTNTTLIWIIIGIAALLLIGTGTTILLIRRRRVNDGYYDGPDGDGFFEEEEFYEDEYDDYGEYDSGEDESTWRRNRYDDYDDRTDRFR